MKLTQTGGSEQIVRRYEYEDSWVVVADLDVDDERVDVDTVGDTAIVVVESEDASTVVDDSTNEPEPRVIETEFDLPAPATKVTTNNGVLTIEGKL